MKSDLEVNKGDNDQGEDRIVSREGQKLQQKNYKEK